MATLVVGAHGRDDRVVIDAGTARMSRYSTRTKVQRLPIEAISQASANQRSGRSGRTRDGIAIRLYSEEDFERRPEFTDPEIRRSSLAGVILRMLHLGLGRIEDFPFLDAPDRRAVRDGVAELPPGHALIAVLHRHGRRDPAPMLCLADGWGEPRGAIATTISHDNHNLLVLGRDPADMAAAANALIASGGGMAVAAGGAILLLLGLSPMAAAAFSVIPGPVLGGDGQVRRRRGRGDQRPRRRGRRAGDGWAL